MEKGSVVFNDGVLRGTLLPNKWVCVEWLTDKIGYLSKTVVKDLKQIEKYCLKYKWNGWVLGSEIENTDMHKLIERFGGMYQKEQDGYKIFFKRIESCVEQPKQ